MNAPSRCVRARRRMLGLIMTGLICSALSVPGASSQPYQGHLEAEAPLRLTRQPAPLATGVNDSDFAAALQARAQVRTAPQPPASGSSLGSTLIGSLVSGKAPSLGQGEALLDNFMHRLSAAHPMFRLNTADRQLVSNSDIALIVDHSGSMKTRDCPGGNGRLLSSRLEWAADEMQIFADDILSSSPHGFSLITFDSHPDVYQIDSAQELRGIMQNLQGGGGTRLDLALNAALSEHEAHRNQPLVIAIVTDGEIDVRSAQQALVSATQRFPQPNGVAVTLLQVGMGAQVVDSVRVNKLYNLQALGAAYDVYSSVPFSQLQGQGFGRSIVAALRH